MRLDMAPGLPAVLIDKVQIQQVVVNLMRNAIEAMAASARRELTVAIAAGADGMVAVRVADTGPGIAPEIADRLFQPFITTKPQGMGVGLVDLPRDRRRARQPVMGRGQSRGRRSVLVYRSRGRLRSTLARFRRAGFDEYRLGLERHPLVASVSGCLRRKLKSQPLSACRISRR
ncbi:MAG: sensor histidine kinase [Stellaceae bacterium]